MDGHGQWRTVRMHIYLSREVTVRRDDSEVLAFCVTSARLSRMLFFRIGFCGFFLFERTVLATVRIKVM